ncbi:hypothetical protein Poly51_63860 [Rubripirellula tenax]|uniref:Uncharacterized protein n=1 Tax=Rubripirellula tenax TaxID=2528015 RepID=A0A5C6DZ18_9BACT|nr:hypothetical protein [Rubripirellula tenax]TWU41685.1 hypothetical protein Poly51_63860 [Rubripirellula tenax]
MLIRTLALLMLITPTLVAAELNDEYQIGELNDEYQIGEPDDEYQMEEAVGLDDPFHVSDVSQLGKRMLVDVTYEKRSFDESVIVNFRTVGPSHDSDTRAEFPRDDMHMVIQGAKGAVVFESGLAWKDTGEKTIKGNPTYIARILVHADMKNGLILTESVDGFDGKSTVGIVTFHSLFNK